jgi:hypothetical protein
MNEKYFTERLFWLPNINRLTHVSFTYGHGWQAMQENNNGEYFYFAGERTYAELMQHYSQDDPQLLLQEGL